MNMPVAKPSDIKHPYSDFETINIFMLVALVLPDPLWLSWFGYLLKTDDVSWCLFMIGHHLSWLAIN